MYFFVQNGDLNTNKISTDCPDATLTKRITITLSSTTFPHTCFFLAWGLTFILVPTRIIVHHRIILTVCIQVQSVTIVGIFLCESGTDRVIISCPQVILSRQRIVLLSRIAEAVVHLFFTSDGIAECIVFIVVEYT